jgi:hypothetical protein
MLVPSVTSSFPEEISLSDIAKSTQHPTTSSDLEAVDYDVILRVSIVGAPVRDVMVMVRNLAPHAQIPTRSAPSVSPPIG